MVKILRADLPIVVQYKWWTWRSKVLFYAYTHINGRRIYMHRLLGDGVDNWDSATNCWTAADVVDHKDRDTLNNTRSNLRVCDYSKNRQNSVGSPSKRRSRFKGVSYSKNRKKPWRATIGVNGKQHSGGYFATRKRQHVVTIVWHANTLASLHDRISASVKSTKGSLESSDDESAIVSTLPSPKGKQCSHLIWPPNGPIKARAVVCLCPFGYRQTTDQHSSKPQETTMNNSNAPLDALAGHWLGKINPTLFCNPHVYLLEGSLVSRSEGRRADRGNRYR